MVYYVDSFLAGAISGKMWFLSLVADNSTTDVLAEFFFRVPTLILTTAGLDAAGLDSENMVLLLMVCTFLVILATINNLVPRGHGVLALDALMIMAQEGGKMITPLLCLITMALSVALIPLITSMEEDFSTRGNCITYRNRPRSYYCLFCIDGGMIFSTTMTFIPRSPHDPPMSMRMRKQGERFDVDIDTLVGIVESTIGQIRSSMLKGRRQPESARRLAFRTLLICS